MRSSESAPTTITSYIRACPKAVQPILRKIREAILAAAPEAEEAIAYGMPTFRLKQNLVHFAAYQHHIGFYPTPSGITTFNKDIRKYKWNKGSVQFPLDQPIPYALIKKITAFRVKALNANASQK